MTETKPKLVIDMTRLQIGDVELVAKYARERSMFENGLSLADMEQYIPLLDRLVTGGVKERPLSEMLQVIDFLEAWAKQHLKRRRRGILHKLTGGK